MERRFEINIGLIIVIILLLVFLIVDQINDVRQQKTMDLVMIKTLDLRSEILKKEIEASILEGMVSIDAVKIGLEDLGGLTDQQIGGAINDIKSFNDELKDEVANRVY